MGETAQGRPRGLGAEPGRGWRKEEASAGVLQELEVSCSSPQTPLPARCPVGGMCSGSIAVKKTTLRASPSLSFLIFQMETLVGPTSQGV